MRQGCKVTLYQDAHCPPVNEMPYFLQMERPDDNFLQMERPGDKQHQPRSCWTDIYQSIQEAKEVICITGWNVWDKLQLLRGSDLSKDQRTLGEILVEKANQGVKVYIMFWSGKNSGAIIGEEGIMRTRDMDTYNFFKQTKVMCALAFRHVLLQTKYDFHVEILYICLGF